MLNFKIKKIQFALFPKNFNPVDKSKIAQDIKIQTNNIFDGEDTILPLPIDAPFEIPRIILKSKSGNLSCNISLSRIDFFRNTNSEDKLSDIKDELIKTISQISSYFIDNSSVLIGRMGFVVDFNFNTGEDGGIKFLKRNLLKEGSYHEKSLKTKGVLFIFTEVDDSSEFELNKQYQYGNELNDSLSFRFDINTSFERTDEYNLKTEDIVEIVKKAIDEISDIKLNSLFSQNDDE